MLEITENEIISKWNGEGVVVSVCMLAFNHEDYVAEALEGILSQDVGFRYEILVHDDASTDGTADIIRKYAERFPRIIKPVYQQQNHWSRGINPTVFFNYPRVQGEYVAWCEGDDVWIDPKKLQVQIEILEQHKDVDICFHLAKVRNYSSDSSETYTIGCYGTASGVVGFDDVFLRTYGMIPTAACVVRHSVMLKISEFIAPRPYLTCGDIYMQALGGLKGGAYFIDREMSFYRFRTASSLTRELSLDIRKFLNHNVSSIRGCISLWRNYFPEKGEIALKKLIYKRLHWIFFKEEKSVDLVDEMNIRSLYSMYLSIDEYIEKLCRSLDGRKIVVYGCGNEADLIIGKLGAEKICFVIDRDGKKLDGDFKDVPLKPFEEIGRHTDAILVISTMYYDAQELERKTKSLGIEEERMLRIDKEILGLINVDAIWQDEDLMDRESVLASRARPSGWWAGAQKETVVLQ